VVTVGKDFSIASLSRVVRGTMRRVLRRRAGPPARIRFVIRPSNFVIDSNFEISSFDLRGESLLTSRRRSSSVSILSICG
jgi:hypothetical protein